MIKVSNVGFNYKNGNKVLKDINLTINDGEFISVIGKNGTGKSTLGRLLAGLAKPTSGEVFIDDLDTSDKKNFMKIYEKIGVVFQNPENQLLFNNVYDELAFGLKNLKKDGINERIEESLAMVGMRDYRDKEIYDMSLGQKQRVAIAEALSLSPKYLIFDEPTTMLDSMGKEEVHMIVKSLKKAGYTIVYITNMADEILLSDRIILLDKGNISVELNKKEIVDNVELLKEYGVRIPTLIHLINELKKKGIMIEVENFEVRDIVNEIVKLKG